MNRWFGIGAALAGLAVALGAFGAHGLKGRVGAENLEWWHTGANYLMALTSVRILGAITPLGGVCFIGGWIWLAISAWQTPWKSDLDEKGP